MTQLTRKQRLDLLDYEREIEEQKRAEAEASEGLAFLQKRFRHQKDRVWMGAGAAGAAGFLLKNTPPQDLIAAIQTVHDGDSVISPGPTRRLLTAVRTGQVSGVLPGGGAGRHASEDSVEAVRAAEASQQVAALTQREREILALIALGLTNQEICDREWLSMPTVKTHVSHLLSKTGCRDRVQLVLLALRGGVIDPADVLGGD